MYIATLGPYWVKRASGEPIICEPVVYSTYPWAANFPHGDDPNFYEAYNLSVPGGVSLNLNLAGLPQSWEPVVTDPVDLGTVRTYLQSTFNDVDGGMYRDDSPDPEVLDLWRYSNSFNLTDPVARATYSQSGITWPDSGPDVPQAPGWVEYPGIASYSSFGTADFKVNAYGLPVVCELWYSLNLARADKLRGYDNYSFIGDWANSSFPYIDVEANDGCIKKYYAGIFKVTADMYAPADADIIAGVTYVGDETGGVMRLLINGIVVDSATVTSKLTYLFGNADFSVAEDTVAPYNANNAKSHVWMMQADSNLWDSGGNVFWDTTFPVPAEAFIDTYQIKYAWMVDADTGLSAGTHDPAAILGWSPGMFYTLPNAPLPCDPEEPLPGTVFTPAEPLNTLMFLETFSGVGKIQGKQPDIAPEGIVWAERWNYEIDQPTVMNAGGLYKLEYPYADWQELNIEDTIGSPNYGTAKLTNVRSFEIGWYDYPITGRSYQKLELDFRNDFGDASIYLTVQGGDEIDYLEIYLGLSDNNGNSGSGTYYIDSHQFNWDTLNTVRVEIDYSQQRVYFNGALVLTVTAQLNSGIDLNMFYLQQFWISYDYIWFSQLTNDTSFVNTTTNPHWHLMTKFHLYTNDLIATIDRSGSATFTVSNTATATVNTVDQVISLNAGEELQMIGTGNFVYRVLFPVGAQTTANVPYYSYSAFYAPVTGNYTIKVGAILNLSFSGPVDWNIYTHPSLPLAGLMPQVGVLPWASDPANPAVVMRYYGGTSLVERIGIAPNEGFPWRYSDIHGAQSPGPSITDKTRRFYASYGDPLLLTPIPPVLDTKELLVQLIPILPTTDVHGNIYTINIGFAEVGGKAITVTVHYQITLAGDGIAVYEGVRQWDQMQMIIKEDGVEIASQTGSRIVGGAFDIAANDGRVGSDSSVEIEIREKTQRIYGFWRGGETSDYNWITLNTNLKDNPYWGNFAHVEFISDTPQYNDDGITLAVEGGLEWVWIKRVEPIFMPTVSANQALVFGLTGLAPDPIGTLQSSGSFALSIVPPTERQTRTFELLRGQVLRAGTSIPGGSLSGSSLTTRLYYGYPDGITVGDYSGNSIERQAMADGTYTLEITSFGGSTGTIAWEIYSNLRS